MRLFGIIRLSRYDMQCIDNAIAFIQKNHRNHISAEQLSIEAGIAIRKLQAGLKRKTGFTLHEYHFQTRIENSKMMLSDTGSPLKAIARSTGFKTESHFCKVFKKFTTVTPMEYRFQNAV